MFTIIIYVGIGLIALVLVGHVILWLYGIGSAHSFICHYCHQQWGNSNKRVVDGKYYCPKCAPTENMIEVP